MILGLLACAAALAATGVVVALIPRAPVAWDAAWIPAWSMAIELRVDGLAIVYSLLATGMAVLAFGYAAAYMPHQLDDDTRRRGALGGFFALLVVFMLAMVALAASGNLLQLFVCWEVTTICSFLLIGFDRRSTEARRAALMALVVTGASAVLLLVGALLLHARYGTTNLEALAAVARADRVTVVACALLVVAALAKSAQWPLHVWLPRAMVAPTPVSAYLHAAAMVAAGVLLLQRIQPLLALDPRVASAVVGLGWTSMLAGGLAALRARTLKRILAYSTIAQYGHVVFLVGIGGAEAAAAASFFVLAHGVCKGALFLAAGAVTHATGADALPALGGLARRLPLLAASTAVAAAGLAGVPLTIGHFKDELLFGAAGGAATPILWLAAVGPALTAAYMWRFWTRVFLGTPRSRVRYAPRGLVWPVAVSAALVLIAGVWPDVPVRLAEGAAASVAGAVSLDAGYHLDLRPSNVAAAAAFGVAALLVFARRPLARLTAWLALAGRHDAAERLYLTGTRGLLRAGRRLRVSAPQGLRARASFVFVVTAALAAAGQLAVGVRIPPLAWSWTDAPLAGAVLVTAVAAVLTAAQRRHLTLVVMLSLTSLALAAACAALGAPDVALVVIIMNVVTSMLLVALLDGLPRRTLEDERTSPRGRPRWRDYVLAGIGGALAFIMAAGTFARPRPERWAGGAHLALAEEAHARNTVTAILADFRGLDTIGEITVILVSVVALERLLNRREARP